MGELCITCRYFVKREARKKPKCILHLNGTTPDDYCSCWESEKQ